MATRIKSINLNIERCGDPTYSDPPCEEWSSEDEDSEAVSTRL